MTGEIKTGSTGQIVIPELAEIRQQMKLVNQAHDLEALDIRNRDYRETAANHYNALTQTAIRLILGSGDIGERSSDDCYKIFVNWKFDSEDVAYSAFRALAKAREVAEESKEGELMASVEDEKLLKVWKPSVPLIGIAGFGGRPVIAIGSPTVEINPESIAGIKISHDDFPEISLDELNDAVIISSDDERIDKVIGVQRIHSFLGELSIGRSLPKIERIIIARTSLGVYTNSELVHDAIIDSFRRDSTIGETLTSIEAKLGLVPEV